MIAFDVAQQVADDATSRVLAQVDTDKPAPAIDFDRLRFDVIEAALDARDAAIAELDRIHADIDD